jgi:FkbM family methyltransferase
MHPRMYELDFISMKRCKHGVFVYNTHDAVIGRSLDAYGEWCEFELDLLTQLIKPMDFVLDIGANIGTHTVCFAKVVGEQGFVIAFEPQRLAFVTLCANVALNALTNVAPMQRGVGRETGMTCSPLYDPRQEQNFGSATIIGHTSGDSVPVMRVDDVNLPRCNLIKVDVEGMECDVLEGARQTIARHRPILFVENNEVARSESVLRTIDSLDYDAYWLIGPIYRSNNFFANPVNIFPDIAEGNVICFHRSHVVNIAGLPKVEGVHDDWQAAFQRLHSQ